MIGTDRILQCLVGSYGVGMVLESAIDTDGTRNGPGVSRRDTSGQHNLRVPSLGVRGSSDMILECSDEAYGERNGYRVSSRSKLEWS